ncbi:hypothetical protein ACFV9C_12855 [Kribbella sp. NPDC059898]|uniref:hypothetical protein n=1 Tax=Kribbella sp. NPDC059898 TaxID=3346995 RepID=UPI003659CAB7
MWLAIGPAVIRDDPPSAPATLARPFRLDSGEVGPRHLYLNVRTQNDPQLGVAADRSIVDHRLVAAVHES